MFASNTKGSVFELCIMQYKIRMADSSPARTLTITLLGWLFWVIIKNLISFCGQYGSKLDQFMFSALIPLKISQLISGLM